MTYYASSAYTERYYILFQDIDGNQWKVSIQDPTFSGTATELTGAEFPVEWKGVGDESQTDVVLGSTGNLHLIIRTGQESIFAKGNLFPTEINDRRVQVKRYMNNNWFEYWQGFIKPEQYTQDWDRAPFEIDLPIVSAIAASEYFVMPDYTDVQEKSNIADLLRYVIGLLGCDYNRLITNNPIYRDFNGNTQNVDSGGSTVPAHWTQGSASSTYFYDFGDDGITPKTIKDVLELICAPYGKIHEYYKDIAVMMRQKLDADDSNNRLYSLSLLTSETTVRFVDLDWIPRINLSDIQVAGTNNNVSVVAKPAAVKFSNNIEPNHDIFDLTEKYIKPSLPLDTSLVPSLISLNAGDVKQYVYPFSKDHVDSNFYEDLAFHGSSTSRNTIFCRVVQLTAIGDDPNRVTYSVSTPLAFYLDNHQAFSFILANRVRSTSGYNKVKFSANTGGTTHLGPQVAMAMVLVDLDTSPIKYFDLNTRTWKNFDPSNLPWQALDYIGDSNPFEFTFNEPRTSGDKTPHRLRLYFYNYVGYQINVFISFSLEYVRDDTPTNQGIMLTFAESLIRNGRNDTYGGSGEKLNIEMKTMCGRTNAVINGEANIPYNSFCDAQTFIDDEDREKIEIDAVKFERYNPTGIYLFDLITSYAVIVDGSKNYIPVAVGMNPRMNTVWLRLINTNVTPQ